jgi:hypothetical protein
MKKSPLASVKDRFESKEKLITAVQALASADLWLDRLNDVKGLGHVSNAKLLRLHDILKDARERFGTREKLVAAVLTLMNSVKDAGMKARLESFPLPRLLDLHRVLTRKSAAAAK